MNSGVKFFSRGIRTISKPGRTCLIPNELAEVLKFRL